MQNSGSGKCPLSPCGCPWWLPPTSKLWRRNCPGMGWRKSGHPTTKVGGNHPRLDLDFAKAFDKVPHKRLAKKLQACGITGQALTWIQSWLSGRRQKVGIGDKHSSWRTELSGVPQGSVLGPLLFVIFINDIDDGILSKISKFADDTKLCRAVGDDQEANILREDLRRMFICS